MHDISLRCASQMERNIICAWEPRFNEVCWSVLGLFCLIKFMPLFSLYYDSRSPYINNWQHCISKHSFLAIASTFLSTYNVDQYMFSELLKHLHYLPHHVLIEHFHLLTGDNFLLYYSLKQPICRPIFEQK